MMFADDGSAFKNVGMLVSLRLRIGAALAAA